MLRTVLPHPQHSHRPRPPQLKSPAPQYLPLTIPTWRRFCAASKSRRAFLRRCRHPLLREGLRRGKGEGSEESEESEESEGGEERVRRKEEEGEGGGLTGRRDHRLWVARNTGGRCPRDGDCWKEARSGALRGTDIQVLVATLFMGLMWPAARPAVSVLQSIRAALFLILRARKRTAVRRPALRKTTP